MDNSDRPRTDNELPRNRPWFGPKSRGRLGYRPQTWQGYLITALTAVYLVTLAAVTNGHSHWMLLGLIPFILILVIAWAQRR